MLIRGGETDRGAEAAPPGAVAPAAAGPILPQIESDKGA